MTSTTSLLFPNIFQYHCLANSSLTLVDEDRMSTNSVEESSRKYSKINHPTKIVRDVTNTVCSKMLSFNLR